MRNERQVEQGDGSDVDRWRDLRRSSLSWAEMIPFFTITAISIGMGLIYYIPIEISKKKSNNKRLVKFWRWFGWLIPIFVVLVTGVIYSEMKGNEEVSKTTVVFTSASVSIYLLLVSVLTVKKIWMEKHERKA